MASLFRRKGTASKAVKRANLPTIGKVGTVKVMMFYNDHVPPHVHVQTGDYHIVVSVISPGIPPAVFPKTFRKRLLQWIAKHETELLANWARAQAGLPLTWIK